MKVVFLDRDGTIIMEPPDERVDKEEKIQLFPDSIEALKYLADNDYAVIVITNQAGIAEGKLDENEFQRINSKLWELLEPSGVKMLKTYFCPHSPNDNCECRKPKTKMLLDAAKDFNVNLADTYMIGDRETDIIASIKAGTKTVFVQTGNDPVTLTKPTYTAANLLEAVKYIVSH